MNTILILVALAVAGYVLYRKVPKFKARVQNAVDTFKAPLRAVESVVDTPAPTTPVKPAVEAVVQPEVYSKPVATTSSKPRPRNNMSETNFTGFPASYDFTQPGVLKCYVQMDALVSYQVPIKLPAVQTEYCHVQFSPLASDPSGGKAKIRCSVTDKDGQILLDVSSRTPGYMVFRLDTIPGGDYFFNCFVDKDAHQVVSFS